MEHSKNIFPQLVFVLPGFLSLATAVYSIIYWDDLVSKLLTAHLAFVSLLPALIEYWESFRNYVLPDSSKVDPNYMKIGILFYICIATSIFGVGVLASVSAIVTLVAAIILLIYQFKFTLAEKFGLGYELPKFEAV